MSYTIGMLDRMFIFLTNLSAGMKSSAWRWWYQRLASYYQKSDWRFMNYGYQPMRDPEPLPLDEEDEPNRLYIQLYDYVLQDVDLTGKRVLEVGSGRGGGCDYVARYKKPYQLYGVDYSPKAIKLSQSFYSQPNLTFMEGNSEKLPFKPNVFDVVYNIESSHCYGNMQAFISEVERVLKPGGIFCWADLRTPKAMDKEEELFEQSKLKILLKEEITPNVIKALELASDSKDKAIRASVPRLVLQPFREFAAVKNTKIFNAFKSGSLEYWLYRLQK